MCKKGVESSRADQTFRRGKSIKNNLDWDVREVQGIFCINKRKLVNLVVCIHCVFEGGWVFS